MIRTHGCVPLRVPRFVHIRGCLSGGLAYCEYLPGEFESPGYHAELDALVTPDYDYARPEDSILTPDAEDQLFPLPDVSGYQSLPAPGNPSQSSLQD